ncbi:DinB family protein [Actinomadura gamaensis]|uniref:DinB family protein n=1 Tax=Actinomadura gamaensis TaxID=1763541 RepID=A0ABV9U4G2_9ACTN
MASVQESITAQFDYAWRRTRDRLDGLTDAEYLWEPVPDGWTLRPDASGRWQIDGEGGGGPAPDPVPIPTIAWRMGHVALAFVDYGERLFHGRNITLDDVEFQGTAEGGTALLEDAYRRHWREPLGALAPDDWWRAAGPAFFAHAEKSALDVALHVLDEFVHHSAEIGVLRDLHGRIGGAGS